MDFKTFLNELFSKMTKRQVEVFFAFKLKKKNYSHETVISLGNQQAKTNWTEKKTTFKRSK